MSAGAIRRGAAPLTAAVLAAALAGCGLSAAPAATSSTGRAPTPRVARSSGSGAGRPAGGWRTPVRAVATFAALYVNWDAGTVARRLRTLARVSIGQARAAMTLEAAEVARDRALRGGGIANSGVVEAVAPVVGHAREYAVVTRERTSASHGAQRDAYRGLPPEWHVTVATVTRTAGGLWVLSGWQPES